MRGAPAIGVSVAYAMALAALQSDSKDSQEILQDLEKARALLAATRPTATNLFWALDHMMAFAREKLLYGSTDLPAAMLSEAERMADEDVSINQRLAEIGAELIPDGAVILSVQPHAVYTVSPENLQQAGKLAEEFGVYFVTHASETEAEVSNSIRDFGLSPVRHLDRLGLLGERSLLAHCVHLQDDEFDLLGERGSVVSHCPMSNLKIGSGIANIARMLENGVKVTLGTDGPVSGNDLNPWFAMRLAPALQKAIHKDSALLTAPQVVQMATQKAAEALGLGEQLGSLEPGKRADILLVRIGKPHSRPAYDPYALLVYNVGREDVDTVLVNGKIVVRQGRLVNLNEQELIDHIDSISQKVRQFLN